MLPNLSALALGRQEAPTAGLFGKKKTPEEKAEANKAKVIAEFKAMFVEFFRSACHYYTAGRDYDDVNVETYDERQERRRKFGELKKGAPLCEGKKGDKVQLPGAVWWDIVKHYEDHQQIIDGEFPNHRKDNGDTIFFDFSKADRDAGRGYMAGTVWEQYYLNVVYWRSQFPDKTAEEWATEFLARPAAWQREWNAKRLQATAPKKKKKKKKPSGV